jgi:hypothetical protein
MTRSYIIRWSSGKVIYRTIAIPSGMDSVSNTVKIWKNSSDFFSRGLPIKLEEIRRKIDKIDRELLVLLQERMGLALRSKKFKMAISDPQRKALTISMKVLGSLSGRCECAGLRMRKRPLLIVAVGPFKTRCPYR